jgi:L-histidine N-alpha-methyltransferase
LSALADSDRIKIDSWLSEREERALPRDVRSGLTGSFKELPPKHFYDSRGSELFEQICELPEYYPTRTELAILTAQADRIVEQTGAGELVELGAGASVKARLLLDAMERAGTLERYVPLDVSERVVREAAQELVRDYDELHVHGVVGDFERHLPRVPSRNGTPRLVALLGGTIGNFKPEPRRQLLAAIADMLKPEDRLLLGTDLVKEPAVLEAAYDDSAGVTAEFNRNVLHVINRELGADFPVGEFEHVAFFDHDNEWIEMRLRAQRAMTVEVPGAGVTIEFEHGEEMRTEISAKFTQDRLNADLAAAGLALDTSFVDDDGLFSLSLIRLA